MGERGRNKKLGNFRGTIKKKKWINESYAQPNDNNHLKHNLSHNYYTSNSQDSKHNSKQMQITTLPNSFKTSNFMS